MANKILSALGVRLFLEGQNFKKGLEEGKRNLLNFKNIGKSVMTAFATYWSVQQIAAFGKELLDISLKAEGVQRAFDRFGDAGYLEELKEATSGAVSELELMTRAVNAKNLGLPIDQLANYFKFATIRAAETGESIDYLVNSIVLGIGRRSVKIIDNLGISAIRINEEFAKTGDWAVAVGNIIKEEFEEMGDIADLNVQKVGRIRAEWEDAKKSFGEKIQPTMTEHLDRWTTKLNAISDDSLSSWEKLGIVLFKNATAVYKYYEGQQEYYKLAKQASLDESDAIEKKIPLLDDLTFKLDLAKKARDESITEAQLAKYNRKIQQYEEELKYLNALGKIQKAPKTPEERLNLDVGVELDIGTGEVESEEMFGYLRTISKEASAEIDSLLSSQEDVFKTRLDNINSIIQSGFKNAAIGIGEGVGNLIASGSFDPAYFLEPFANMAIQLGELAIATGIGIKAIQKAFLGNPAAAIIAGVALVALGTAVKASLSNIGSSVGASSSSSVTATTDSVTGGESSTSSNLYDRSRQTIKVEIEGTLKGKDIYLSNKNYERTHNLTT